MGKRLPVTESLLFLSFRHKAILKSLIYSLFLLGAMLLCNVPLFAQQKEVTGTVADEKNQPLEGITVNVKGTTIGTVTNADGMYAITAGPGQTLQFTFIGKAPAEKVVGSDNTVNVSLKTGGASNLDEVVVTGYMTQKKADLTGAIAVVSPKDLSKGHGVTNVMQSLQGVVPGLHVTTDGNPSGNVGIQVRGLTSINGSNPLIVIDGVPSYMNLRDINPDNIASMQVLKDAYSASIYGTQGGSGVILIQTKQGRPGKAKITYNGSYGVSNWNNRPAMLNTMQYGQALWQAAINDGQDPAAVTRIYTYDWQKDANGIPVLNTITPRKYLNADSTMIAGNTNWLDAISQNGIQNNHQLSISGGNEKATSYLSLNYLENQGTQIYTGFKRFTVRVNTEYKVINDHFTIGENIEASHMIDNNQNVMHEALVEPSIIPVHSTNGGWGVLPLHMVWMITGIR